MNCALDAARVDVGICFCQSHLSAWLYSCFLQTERCHSFKTANQTS